MAAMACCIACICRLPCSASPFAALVSRLASLALSAVFLVCSAICVMEAVSS